MEHLDLNNKKIKCKSCKLNFSYDKTKCYWDEKGLVSTKLTKCLNCGLPVVVSYWEDPNLDVNSDRRFYEYFKKKKQH